MNAKRSSRWLAGYVVLTLLALTVGLRSIGFSWPAAILALLAGTCLVLTARAFVSFVCALRNEGPPR